MPLCQHSATQLQLHHLYPQNGVLCPHKISSDSQSHCTPFSFPHRFHHRTLVVVSLTALKHTLISLPPLLGMKGETLLNHVVGIWKQMYHDKQKEHKVSDDVHIRSPTKKNQKDFIPVDYQRVLDRNIMVDVGDGVNLKQAARARLDNLATATTSHNENASWLYHRCTDAIKEIQSEMTALQIELILWRVVTKIEVYQQFSVVNNDDSV